MDSYQNRLNAELIKDNFRTNEDKFRTLADTAPSLIYLLKGSRLIYVNIAFETITGYSQEECLHMQAWDFINPEYHDFVKEKALARQRGEINPDRYETKILTKTGQSRWADFSTSVINLDGEMVSLGVASDITKRKIAEDALRESEQLLNNIINFLPDATLVVDLEGRVIAWNQAIERLTGVKSSDIIGRDNYEYALAFYGERRPILIDQVLETYRHSNKDNAAILENITGEEYCSQIGESGAYLYGIAAPLYDVSGKMLGAIESMRDITEQKKAADEIIYLSKHDKLTGLYNRAYFEQETNRMDNEANLPLTMIIGDVNGLKMVNDAFGHHKGDHLLKTVADIFVSSISHKKAVIARWGGDEFVILLPKTTEDLALKICADIKHKLTTQESFPVQVSISLGVATKKYSPQKISNISKEAEDRMYRNKLLESKSNRSSFINSLENTLWSRSHETQAHTQRVRKMVLTIGNYLDLPDSEISNLILLASLHDIGKIAIPNSILDKPGKLSAEEWELMKKHSEIGYRIALSSPELTNIADSILAHHERWDQTGYPLGIGGIDIPLNARILSIADACDVMLHGRPYQAKISLSETLNEVAKCAGTQFDPDLVKLFLHIMSNSNPLASPL
ncbi:MAG: PAS domain S-box protein [Syntrophomonadaceae bacterium]|nr:PAS domain S-box protein [Syntrophomonadaceae bacterium]